MSLHDHHQGAAPMLAASRTQEGAPVPLIARGAEALPP